MASAIEDLVSMGDIESLYEIMAEHDDWMTQLDAAEGLVKLRDKRGLEFLLSAELSDDDEIKEVAKEILNSPKIKSRIDDIRLADEQRRAKKIEIAKRRLQKGKKVFCYKMVFLSSGDFLNEDPSLDEGFFVPALNELGFEGWEVVNIIPRFTTLSKTADEHLTGAHFLLKREVTGDESSELR